MENVCPVENALGQFLPVFFLEGQHSSFYVDLSIPPPKVISWASPRRHPCANAARPPAQPTRAPPRNLMPPPVPRAGGRLLSSRTTAAPTSQPTGLVGKEQGKCGLSAAAETVITTLFYLWPPGIHTASPLLVLLYHHPQFCLSAGAGREVPLQQGGAEQRKRRRVSLGREGGGRGDREPAAPTGAVDRQGPGRGFLGPRCRPWEPPRPVLLEVDEGRATLSAGALGGRVVPCLTRWVLNQRGQGPAGGRDGCRFPGNRR